MLEARGELDEAEHLYREAVKFSEKLDARHPDTLTVITNLASLLQAHGKLVEVEHLYNGSSLWCRRHCNAATCAYPPEPRDHDR